MEIFSQKFFSIYFNVAIVMIVIGMVLKIWRNLSIGKAINTVIQLPDYRKERIIRLYLRILSGHRIVLWIMPFGFLLVLAMFVLLSVFPELNSGLDIDLRKLLILMGILFVAGFIHVLEDSAYKKKILNAIDGN